MIHLSSWIEGSADRGDKGFLVAAANAVMRKWGKTPPPPIKIDYPESREVEIIAFHHGNTPREQGSFINIGGIRHEEV